MFLLGSPSALAGEAQESSAGDGYHIYLNGVLRDMAHQSLQEVASRSVPGTVLSGRLFDTEFIFGHDELFFCVPAGVASMVGTGWALANKAKIKNPVLIGAAMGLSLFAPCFVYNLVTQGAERDVLGAFRDHFGNGYYLARIKYTLRPNAPTLDEDKGKGSCRFFFSIDEENLTVDYEIDSCTHKNIFPETVPGNMRVGGQADWFDEKAGRTLVVASETGRSLVVD